MIPPDEWVWCGLPGHFIGAHSCEFHLHTRVGDYRVSTVGDYRPSGPYTEPVKVGLGRLYETFVFRAEAHGEHGEGEVADWGEIVDALGANDATEADRNHMAMCKKYAALDGEA